MGLFMFSLSPLQFQRCVTLSLKTYFKYECCEPRRDCACIQPAGIVDILLGLSFISAFTSLAALESVQEKWWEAEKSGWKDRRKEKWRGTKKQKGANEVREERERVGERARGKRETCTTICHT